ncbi:MAG: transcriptional regulator [Candidatus Abawacabacteria bacterium]|nr:transcriptional regulator [Candidatus Abawacabacteria bacterium]
MSLIKALEKVANAKELSLLLEVILTPKELQEIGQRLEILNRLEHGEPQHKIAQKLHVGVATVTRGASVIRSNSYQKIKHLLTT